MNVPAYLHRIGYTGSVTPTLETLRRIHRAHLETVPFENLDISLGRPIVLNEDAFVRKVVEENRGGFCYELNGALAALLREMGFRVTLLSARAPHKDGSPGPEFDHLTLRVDLDQPWLVDVGFGEGFLEPLPLRAGIEQRQDQGTFRITQEGASLSVERQQHDGSWKTEYLFTLMPRQLEDFADMCHYHQTSPESHFTQKRLCTRATPTGRVTLSDMRLITTENGNRLEVMLGSEDEWRQALKQHFGLVLPTYYTTMGYIQTG
jgi:N-hydroxyarylamine O-acetyltransferase